MDNSIQEKHKWYMITTISGKEEKVLESLKNRVSSESLEDVFSGFEVMMIPYLSPRENEKRLAKKDYKVRNKNLYPGYIFIKMNMTNEAWFMVRNTQYITGLVGSSGSRTKPTPVSNVEMRKMKKQIAQIKSDFESGKFKSPFVPGTIVEVIDGPTKGQSGQVIETNDDRGVSIVELILFERKTPTEIQHKNLKIKH